MTQATSSGSNAVKLVVSLFVPLLVGVVGGIVTAPAIGAWYTGLKKPAFNPPAAVFGPAWTVLYLLMGVAFFLVWRRAADDPLARFAMAAFGVQLALNLAWSLLFFGLHSPLLGLVDIALLWLAILITIVYFFRVSTAAGVLMLPYILWVTFAAALNFSIWTFN